MQEPRKTWVQSLGQEDPLEEEMETHSSILAWRILMDRGALWTTVPGIAKSWTLLKRLSKMKSLSRVRLLVTPWTAAYQAPLSMGFSSQEYCNGLPFHK